MSNLTTSAAGFLPEDRSLDALREAAATCEGCALYKDATQTVFGEGQPTAKVVLIGEQPGDEEDKTGRPFVGPAGRLLDRALIDAGIDREAAYITNAVKHFKWESRGRRRIHKNLKTARLKPASLGWLTK
jgi:uracil-DNA glycosylase